MLDALVAALCAIQIRQQLPTPDPTGQCYAASEALQHILGPKAWMPAYGKVKGNGRHWWLRRRSDLQPLDVTYDQFARRVDYAQGRGCGFLTPTPSKAALVILENTP